MAWRANRAASIPVRITGLTGARIIAGGPGSAFAIVPTP
jgi:hypothetical protein